VTISHSHTDVLSTIIHLKHPRHLRLSNHFFIDVPQFSFHFPINNSCSSISDSKERSSCPKLLPFHYLRKYVLLSQPPGCSCPIRTTTVGARPSDCLCTSHLGHSPEVTRADYPTKAINDPNLSQRPQQSLNPVLASMTDMVRKILVAETEYELRLPGPSQKTYTRGPDERELRARATLTNAVLLSPTILWCLLHPGRLHHIRSQDRTGIEIGVSEEKLVKETALLPHCVHCAIRDGAIEVVQSADDEEGHKILQVRAMDTCICASTTVQHACWPCSLEAIQTRHLEFASRRTVKDVSDARTQSKYSLIRCECGNIEDPQYVEFVRKCAGCGGVKTSPFKNFAGHIVQFEVATLDVGGYFDARSGERIGRVESDGSTAERKYLVQEEWGGTVTGGQQSKRTADDPDESSIRTSSENVAQKRKHKRCAEATRGPSPKRTKANPPLLTTAPKSNEYTHIPVFSEDAIRGLRRLNLRVHQFYQHKRKDNHPKDRLISVLEVNRGAILDEQARADMLKYCRTSTVVSGRLQDLANSVSSNGRMTGAEFLTLLKGPDTMAAFLAADNAVALFPAHMLASLRKMGFELRPMYYSARYQNLPWVRLLVVLTKNRRKVFQHEAELRKFVKLCGFPDGNAASLVYWIRKEISMPMSATQIDDLCRMQSEDDTPAASGNNKVEKSAIDQAAKRGRTVDSASISEPDGTSAAASRSAEGPPEFAGDDGIGHQRPPVLDKQPPPYPNTLVQRSVSPLRTDSDVNLHMDRLAKLLQHCGYRVNEADLIRDRAKAILSKHQEDGA